MTDEPTSPTTEPAADTAPEDPKLKELKSRAQFTRPTVKVSHDGVSERLLKELNAALDRDELVKVKFVAMKDAKKILSRVIEQQTKSLMVQRVGHTATYYRARGAGGA
jgi:RNA-binding protein